MRERLLRSPWRASGSCTKRRLGAASVENVHDVLGEGHAGGRGGRRGIAYGGDRTQPMNAEVVDQSTITIKGLSTYAGARPHHVSGADLGHVTARRPHVGP